MNGNETARIFEDSTSIWSVYTSVFSMIFFVCLAIVLMFLTWISQIRTTKKAYICIFMIWICMIFMGIGIIIGGSIFIATTPYWMTNNSECFTGEIVSPMATIAHITTGHFILFIYQGIFAIFSILLIIAHVIIIATNWTK